MPKEKTQLPREIQTYPATSLNERGESAALRRYEYSTILLLEHWKVFRRRDKATAQVGQPWNHQVDPTTQ